jgi:hypothetical protein
MSKLLVKISFCVVTALSIVAPKQLAAGPTNLLTNGSFEQYTMPAGRISASGLTGWTNNNYNANTLGYNFLYLPNTADTTAPLPLWGIHNGGLNTITSSPDGGNFVGMDGAYEQGALSQTLSGLTVGTDYYVSFWFAGAQQHGFNGETTEQFAVALLGNSNVLAPNATCKTAGVQCTGILTDPSHGFTGWYSSGFTFTATAATDTLSFLALGTPNGEPPFSLLDGVVLQIPEPASLVAAIGVGAVFAARLRRRRLSAAA